MITRKEEMLAELRASKAKYVTYGDGDLGTPFTRASAIKDIESMDEDSVGEGTWYECNEKGEIL